MDITTIKVSRETKDRLDKLKEYKKESYESVLKKILWILNMYKTNPDSARASLKKIEVLRLRRRKFEIIEEEKDNRKKESNIKEFTKQKKPKTKNN